MPPRAGTSGRTLIGWGRSLTGEALRERQLSRRELGVAFMMLVAVVVLVFGRHVLSGALSADDWAYIENVRAPSPAGVFGDLWNATHYRPGYAVYYGSILAIIGAHPVTWLATSLITNLLASTMFYLALRELSVVPLHAWLLAVLASAFPYDDATTLWFAVAGPMLAAGFYFAGLFVTVRALRRGRELWSPLQLGGMFLYAISIMCEELSAPVVAVSAAGYLLVAPRRAVARRWVVDVLLAAVIVGVVEYPATPKTVNLTIPFLWEHVKLIVSQGIDAFAQAAFPFAAAPERRLIVALSLVVAGLGLWLLRWLRPPDQRRELQAGLLACGLGAVLAVAGWAILVPGALGYSPGATGNGNRVNGVAAFGIVVLLYGLIRTASLVAFRERPRAVELTRTWTAVVLAVLAAGYIHLVEDDISVRDAAGAEQHRLLSELRAALPAPAPGATVYVTGYRGETAIDVPVFDLPFDLVNAVRFTYRRTNVSAWPLLAPSTLACDPTGVSPIGGGAGPGESSPYGHTYLFNADSGSLVPINNRVNCETVTRSA